MANANVVVIGLSELPVITDIFNQVFQPPRDLAFFERRLKGRNDSLILLAEIDHQPVGFAIGYENKPDTFYCWLMGVLPDYRRAGVGSQLLEAMRAWARDNGYHIIRQECYNWQRSLIHLSISQKYDIVGLRYEADTGTNMIILEQHTQDA